MPTVWYVAWIIMCFQGDCTKFESAPYKENISADFCQQMLVYTFQNTVGPYYDERIDFEITNPNDIKIKAAGCDTTQRTPEDDDGKTWRIGPEEAIEPRDYQLHRDEKQRDIRSQQEKEQQIE